MALYEYNIQRAAFLTLEEWLDHKSVISVFCISTMQGLKFDFK